MLDLGADHGRFASLVVQVKGEGTHAHLFEALLDDIQGGPFFSNEEDPFAFDDGSRQQVGDGLGLACSWRSFEHERLAGDGGGDGLQLG